MIKRLMAFLLLALFVWGSASMSWAQDNFVGVAGTQFTLEGKPFYYAGTNNYYLGIDPSRTQAEIDEVLTDAKAMGLTVVRTWGFNDGSGGLQTSAGVYNEAVFEKLDYAIAKAGELGLKLIIPFVNNWDDYGGMQQYVNWAGGVHHDAFYTDPKTRGWYKDHISAMLNRTNTETGTQYKDDPTIMAWELANEPRHMDTGNATTVKNWIAEMSAYVKSVDNEHLLTTGVEGHSMSEFRDYHKGMPNIDFATMHVYPDYGGNPNTVEAAQQFVDDRIVEANTMLRMPVILEEFGKYRDTVPPIPDPAMSTGGSGSTTSRDQYYQSFYDVMAENHGGGSNFWILYHDTYPDYDGMGVYYPADSSTVNIIETEAARMSAKNTDNATVPIFDFGTSVQGWACDWGGLSVSHTDDQGFPLPEANGALEVTGVNVTASEGWVDGGAVRFIPWNWGIMDFSGEGIEKFTVQVFASEAYGTGLKAALYAHTGDGWDWNEGLWVDLVLGGWTELSIFVEDLDMTSLRDFGVHFAAEGTTYGGPVYIDFLAAETPVPIPGAAFLLGSGLFGLAVVSTTRKIMKSAGKE
ncbi:MAG: cellulase family glycosylhydrolase [Thermodesulfobacteriota bacterium]|nr:cellulase family glycosylhydrolase [Thermodesulfobacteriota bacterium]